MGKEEDMEEGEAVTEEEVDTLGEDVVMEQEMVRVGRRFWWRRWLHLRVNHKASLGFGQSLGAKVGLCLLFTC